MWYAVTGGVGLVIGIGFLIWGLREKTFRYEAEQKAIKAGVDRQKFEEAAKHNIKIAKELEEQINRLLMQITILRNRLTETRARLAQCGDLEAIKDWLDNELKSEEI